MKYDNVLNKEMAIEARTRVRLLEWGIDYGICSRDDRRRRNLCVISRCARVRLVFTTLCICWKDWALIGFSRVHGRQFYHQHVQCSYCNNLITTTQNKFIHYEMMRYVIFKNTTHMFVAVFSSYLTIHISWGSDKWREYTAKFWNSRSPSVWMMRN